MRTGIRVVGGKTSCRLGTSELVIGRGAYSSFVIDDESVSRLHASLRREGDHIELRDLGSTNGTFVNGTRVEGAPVTVVPGDEIGIGDVIVCLEVAEDELTLLERRRTGPPRPREQTTRRRRP